MYTIHDQESAPFAFVQPGQQVKPFGRPSTAKAAHTEPLNLRVDDIAGTRSRLHRFTTSPRRTNPLDPKYNLSRTSHEEQAPVPRFIRDTLNTSDISGAQVRTVACHHATEHGMHPFASTSAEMMPAICSRTSWPLCCALTSQASFRQPSQLQQHNFKLDCSDIKGARPQWVPEWKIAAHARHAQNRPTSAPVRLSHNTAVRSVLVPYCSPELHIFLWPVTACPICSRWQVRLAS